MTFSSGPYSTPPNTDPWIGLDGRLSPFGTPQFPNILNTYHDTGVPDGRYRWPSQQSRYRANGNLGQPPWMVAGVDYYVGLPVGVTLLDWQSITDPNVNVNNATGTVQIEASGVTLDAIDFSLHGGAQLVVNFPNAVISRSKFVLGSAQPGPPNFLINCLNQSNVTITKCLIDGIGGGVGDAAVASNLSSLIGEVGNNNVITYNELRFQWQHFLECFCNAGPLTCKYNLVHHAGNTGITGAHVNYSQFSDSGNLTGIVIAFNTTYQPNEPTSGGTGFQLNCATHSITSEVGNNTMINSPSGVGRLQIFSNQGATICNCHDNYIDKGSSSSAYIYADTSGTSTYTNNVSMTDGHITVPTSFT